MNEQVLAEKLELQKDLTLQNIENCAQEDNMLEDIR